MPHTKRVASAQLRRIESSSSFLMNRAVLVLSLSSFLVPSNSFQTPMRFQTSSPSSFLARQAHFDVERPLTSLSVGDRIPAVTMVDAYTRRESLQRLSTGILAPLAAKPQAAHAQLFGTNKLNLDSRLTASTVEQLPADLSSQDDVKYPSWLEGTWFVRATLTNFSTPLGTRFLGGSSEAINQKSAEEAGSQTGKPVEFFLKYEANPKGGIREDRVFNTAQRLNAFAGRQVVRRVEYVPLDRGGKTLELNTLTYFKGGLVGKTFSTRRRWETTPEGAFYCDENSRQLYGRRCEQSVESRVCPPPITTDQEIITKLQQTENGVQGSVRILGYLNPNDALYFAAGQKAVTISDYQVTYSKVPPPPA